MVDGGVLVAGGVVGGTGAVGEADGTGLEDSGEGFRGICGHQHVPENDHGDPGGLPFTKLIALAKGTTEQEDTMEAKDVWGFHGKLTDGNTDPSDTLAYLRGTNGRVRDLKEQVSGVEEQVGSLSEKLDQLVEKVDALAALLQEESV